MITVRPATKDDLPMLQDDLAKDKRWEQVNLSRGIVMVVELDGEPVMFGHARLAWQIEPIKFLHGKRKGLSAHQQRKATYLAISALENWLRDIKNNPLIRFYFCTIRNRVMQRLAKSFGMMPLYEGNKFFGKDL